MSTLISVIVEAVGNIFFELKREKIFARMSSRKRNILLIGIFIILLLISIGIRVYAK